MIVLPKTFIDIETTWNNLKVADLKKVLMKYPIYMRCYITLLERCIFCVWVND